MRNSKKMILTIKSNLSTPLECKIKKRFIFKKIKFKRNSQIGHVQYIGNTSDKNKHIIDNEIIDNNPA